MTAFVYERERKKVEPPPQRATVLAFIKAEVAAGHPFPAPRDIAKHMGWRNEGSAREVLQKLAADGHLTMRRIRDGRQRLHFEVAP